MRPGSTTSILEGSTVFLPLDPGLIVPRRGGILIIGHVVIIELLAQRRGQGRVGGGRLLDVGRRMVLICMGFVRAYRISQIV